MKFFFFQGIINGFRAQGINTGRLEKAVYDKSRAP